MTDITPGIGIDNIETIEFKWERKTGWIIIAVFLVLYFGLSLAVVGLFLGEVSFIATFLLFVINIIANFGSVGVVGAIRQRVSLKDLGFVKFDKRWILWAILLVLGLLVVRMIIAGIAIITFPKMAEGADALQELFFLESIKMHQKIIILFLAGVLVPIGEELFFRAFIYKWMRNKLSIWGAAVISALIFAGIHGIPIQILMAFPIGIALALVYEKSGSLIPAIIMHSANNLLALGIAFLAVPGL